jgi:hypothetical protein
MFRPVGRHASIPTSRCGNCRPRRQAVTRPVSKAQRLLLLAVVVLTSPLWLTAAAVVGIGRLIQVAVLYALVWMWWIGRARRRVVFVYSDSPHWKRHVETVILPKLPANAVVLNWSNRSRWETFSLPVMLFRCFAGSREFNPIGLVFERFNAVDRYRFWQPFRDAKHGQLESLQRLEAEFLRHAAG